MAERTNVYEALIIFDSNRFARERAALPGEIEKMIKSADGEVLVSRTPDVQEADLSSRGLGTMYRLVVGPPGSRDAASGVCSQLKTAGYQGCWVMAY